jgi:hypothetical protein
MCVRMYVRSARMLLAFALAIFFVASVGYSQTVVRITPINLGPENLTINNGAAADLNRAALPSEASLEGTVSVPSADLVGTLVNAPAVNSFLQGYVDWSENNTESASYVHDVEIFAASNDQDGTVGYIEGVLKYNPASGAFEGSARQYFNNRGWNQDTLQNPAQKAAPMVLYPFDPTRTDDVNISLDAYSINATIANASTGASQTVSLKPEGGLLYGSSTSGAPAVYVVSLKMHRTPV